MHAIIIRFARREGATLLFVAVVVALTLLLARMLIIPTAGRFLSEWQATKQLRNELKNADSLSRAVNTIALRSAQLKARCLSATPANALLSIDAAGGCDRLVHIADEAGIRFVRLMPDPEHPDNYLSCEFNEPFARTVTFFSALERTPDLIVENSVMQVLSTGTLQVRCVVRYSEKGAANAKN